MAKKGFKPVGHQTERDRTNLRICGFPTKILTSPQETRERGLKLVEELKIIEEQITAWEDTQPLWFLERLPWWEERKKYREMKAKGEVPELDWWEALHWFEASSPYRMDDPKNWGLYLSPPNRIIRARANLKRAQKAAALAASQTKEVSSEEGEHKQQ